VLLEADRARVRRQLAKLRKLGGEDPAAALRADRLEAHGARYSVTVSAWSNARLRARLSQTSLEPGAELRLTATLSEYGLPVSGRARVSAELVRPDAVARSVALDETEPGAFATAVTGDVEGVWRARVSATGHTHHGARFTREQLLSAAVQRGADRPPQRPGEGELGCLLDCLLDDEAVRRLLEERGIDWELVRRCIARCGQEGRGDEQLDRLG
jgi:hypothetical protein